MKRLIILALAVLAAPAAVAELYKYVDKDGKTVYTDQPPANVESKPLHVPTGHAAPAAPAKSYVERDKELEKARQQERDKEKKAEQAAQRDEQNQERCARAREALRVYSDGGRIQRLNEKGERVFLDDEQIAAERERARKEVDAACKKE